MNVQIMVGIVKTVHAHLMNAKHAISQEKIKLIVKSNVVKVAIQEAS